MVEGLRASMNAALIGQERLVERLLVGLLAGGHVLLEGAPGLAKTRAVKRLAMGVEGGFNRIQCTPDLMPADLTGAAVYRPDTGAFDFAPGPVFASLVLVDEINRAPPKVQSALLEAMAEHQVTSGGVTRPLPDPFMVVATQNPIEHEGTFPLPEAQLDRFLLYVKLEMPGRAAERAILDLVEREETAAAPPPPPRLSAEAVRGARAAAMTTHLSPVLRDHIVGVVAATREGEGAAAAIEHPVSPRGTLALAACAKARAWLLGRDHAMPEDVAELAGDALAHRMTVDWRAAAEGVDARGVVARLLAQVPAP
ncbi:AAA family ATPase [Rubrimonas cliftonensis]|uniref:MoxR-like ATPase n=1 Tax=Rubrimonas cliftonensis TaxID=89524 RepID=A0A1H4E3V2_9RHOB|nr:AAA family ATPase [Rubrimonas cliftonensis]SEA79683.1 MoxR-like ATPase [Rubrimonas cliftonensis]